LPGDVGRMVDKALLQKLARQLTHATVLVTGTNGKTTTTAMITHVLRNAGTRVVTNASGANLVAGISAALIRSSSCSGMLGAQAGVFEVDEFWLEEAVIAIHPKVVVVMNVVRDQLDRSGELETTAFRIGAALRKLNSDAFVVANVDDPLVYTQVRMLPNVIGVGIESDAFRLSALHHSADARNCPLCESPLTFERIVAAHFGKYHCSNCDFARPTPQHAVTHFGAVGFDQMHLTLDEEIEVSLALGGIYNAYNVIATFAACQAVGLDTTTIVKGLDTFHAHFGRQEQFEFSGRRMRMLLAKNPTSFNEVLRTTDEFGHIENYLIAINDNIADSRDISWLWDVDFERLARSHERLRIVASGKRAEDVAVRLKYAGVPADRVKVEPDLAAALQLAAEMGDGRSQVAVLPTYTAMLGLREVAQQQKAVRPFWKEAS
jgi:UDP-N-acetylmuramyl tripeptide synthase